ncbi:hypothetical protein BGX27_003147 [Mortierella sp. AM989]|nr:hypothetical protein BGX27_003147 [Mortierella sp. AM989]
MKLLVEDQLVEKEYFDTTDSPPLELGELEEVEKNQTKSVKNKSKRTPGLIKQTNRDNRGCDVTHGVPKTSR